MCTFLFSCLNGTLLACSYQTQGDPEYVEYVKFSDDIERIFTTKELEKMPLLEVEQFKPQADSTQPIVMTPEMEQSLNVCMNRVAEKVNILYE